jgi:hypothetical protein
MESNEYSDLRPLLIPEMAMKTDAISHLESAKQIIANELKLPDGLEKTIMGFIDRADRNP